MRWTHNAHAGVLVADHHALARDAHRPELRRVHHVHPVLDRGGLLVRGLLQRGEGVERRLGLVIEPVGGVVRLELADVGAARKVLDERAVAAVHEDHVGGPEGLVRDAACLEHRDQRRLRPCSLGLQGLVDVPAAGVLVLHPVGQAHVCLRLELDHERRRLAVGCVPQDQVLDLSCEAGPLDAPGSVVATEDSRRGQGRREANEPHGDQATSAEQPSDQIHPALPPLPGAACRTKAARPKGCGCAPYNTWSRLAQ